MSGVREGQAGDRNFADIWVLLGNVLWKRSPER